MDDIKVIIFDLGGVVFENGTRKIKEFLKREYHLTEDILNIMFYGHETYLFRTGQLSPNEFWSFIDSIAVQEKLEIRKNEIRSLWYNFFTPREGIFTLLELLHNNYELGIISGNIKERISFLDEKYNFRKYFDWEVYSFDVGVNKPDPKIYQEALMKTKELSSKCLYIDDKDIFIEPAKKLGMHTILFKNYEVLLKDMARKVIFK